MREREAQRHAARLWAWGTAFKVVDRSGALLHKPNSTVCVVGDAVGDDVWIRGMGFTFEEAFGKSDTPRRKLSDFDFGRTIFAAKEAK